jgi:AcrR family transcriptional regulator
MLKPQEVHPTELPKVKEVDGPNAKEGRVDRRKRQVRARLDEAAQALMIEKGADGMSMLDVTQRADVTSGTIYNYFRD